MSDAVGPFERIQAMIAEHGLEPSPSNYEFLYRYVTGADPQLAAAVEAAGTIDNRTIGAIRRELYGTGRDVGRVIGNAERQLRRITDYVERSDADARSYRDKLGHSDLNPSATLDRQRAALAEMVEATNAMIAQTECLQQELARSSQEIEMLRADLEIARVESRSDALTGLANRKACCDYLDAQIARAAADGATLSLIFLDVDHFKKFNDNYGHRMGDEVLRLIGQSLERSFHGLGYVARWGGEEFVIVMPGHSALAAAAHAERFREHIATRTVRQRQSGREIGRITLSLGVAEIADGDTAQHIIDRADEALYDAKADGRDRVVTWRDAA